MNALVYVDIDQGIHQEKIKIARNKKKNKKIYAGFLITKIWQILNRFGGTKTLAKTSNF